MITRQICFEATSNYCISGKISSDTRRIWFVFHGYGQLARDFLKQFQVLQKEDTCIIAPQGLSLFYLRGSRDSVGASWLTREEREAGMYNQMSYLRAIYQAEIAALKTIPDIYVLGFSQGAATASRWTARSAFPFVGIVLWGGHPDHEITKETAARRFKNRKFVVVFGSKDHLVAHGEVRKLKTNMSDLGLQPEYLEYEGGHEIREDLLGSLAANLYQSV